MKWTALTLGATFYIGGQVLAFEPLNYDRIAYVAENSPASAFVVELDGDGDGALWAVHTRSDIFSMLINLTGPLCTYLIGDINPDNQQISGDITYGVRYFKVVSNPLTHACSNDPINTTCGNWLHVAADLNEGCNQSWAKITRSVSYFKVCVQLQS